MAVSAFCLYWLFPSDAVRKYITAKINDANPDVKVAIAQIKPNFPPGLKLNQVNLSHKESPAISADWVKIMPKFLTLFGSYPTYAFKGNTCDGMVEGQAVMAKSDEKESGPAELRIDADLSAIQMADIPAIQDPAKYKLAGTLDGNVTYIRKKPDKTIHAKLTASNGHIEMSAPLFSNMGILGSVFKKGKLPFKRIDADVEIIKQKNIQIKECNIEGNQLAGKISGTVVLNTPRDRSRLNLEGTIKPHPALLEKLGAAASLLFKRKGAGDGIPFRIKGTFKQPSFSLK